MGISLKLPWDKSARNTVTCDVRDLDCVKKIVSEVPDVDDPAKINYWLTKDDDYKVYLEGWSDKCLAGTGFPLMAEGEHTRKIAYIKDLTPDILKRMAKKHNLQLIEGGFIEREDADYLYGVTYGIYRIKEEEK